MAAPKGAPLRVSSNHRKPGPLEKAYQLYRMELRRFFARRSRDPHAVDDLMQSMYLSLSKARPAEAVRNPRTYLFGIAWHLLHDENRRVEKERRRSVGCDFAEFDAYADRSNRLWVEDDASSDQQRAELERVLKQLPVACQVAVLRQYRDNWSYAEIARELGVTPHAVKKYMVRALNHFRMYFNACEADVRQEGKR